MTKFVMLIVTAVFPSARNPFLRLLTTCLVHYRVENGGIGWLVISQKCLNFWTKWNCKIWDNMGSNGLG